MNATAEEQVAALDTEKRTLQARLREIEETRRGLEEAILDSWTRQGINSVKIDGMTLYLSEIAHVKTLDKAAAIAWLSANIGPDALNVGVQQLAARVRENHDFGEELKATGAFDVGSEFVLRSRKS